MVLARHVLCVPGTWAAFDTLDVVIRAYGGDGFSLDRERSHLSADDRLPAAFDRAADRMAPTFDGKAFKELRKHTAVAYVVGPTMPPGTAAATSGRVLALTAALLDAGAMGVKSEGSGIVHGVAQWAALATASLSEDTHERGQALYKAFVRRPISGDGALHTCGLHLLGQRDVEVPLGRDPMDDTLWLDLMGIYQVTERPDGDLRAGETIGAEAGGERRVLHDAPCTRYPQDHPYFNPQGYWRLEPVPGAEPAKKRRWGR